MKIERSVTGWHWSGKTLRDGSSLPEKGDRFTHDGDLVACPTREELARGAGGYHLSERALGALEYARGPMVARVKGTYCILHGEPVDKYVCRHREYLTDYVDATDVLVAFTRWCALRTLRIHAPRALRKAGLAEHADKLAALADDCDRAAASDAAWNARAAARNAVRAAAWDAASDAAWNARDAVRAAAWAAERALQSEKLEDMLRKIML